jgi:hypothetical protein
MRFVMSFELVYFVAISQGLRPHPWKGSKTNLVGETTCGILGKYIDVGQQDCELRAIDCQ